MLEPRPAWVQGGRGIGPPGNEAPKPAMPAYGNREGEQTGGAARQGGLLSSEASRNCYTSDRFDKPGPPGPLDRANNATKAAFGVSPTPDPDMRAEGAQSRDIQWRNPSTVCVSVGSYHSAVARAFIAFTHSEASLL